MASSKGLYYPWIDVRDDAWLKTALLYWDTLHTIVPESIDEPYSSDVGRALRDFQFLVPLRVHPHMHEVQALAAEALDYLNTREGAELLLLDGRQQVQTIHAEKLPGAVQDLVRIHPDKLPYQIESVIRRADEDVGSDWVSVDSRFAQFYMTLLANKLSERTGASLVTPLDAAQQLAIRARCDARVQQTLSKALRSRQGRSPSEYAVADRRRDLPCDVAVGAIAHLAIERISVDPDTPIDKLFDFKVRHQAELVEFRNKIAELASTIDSDLPESALRQKAQDIYEHQVAPAVSNVKKSLAGRAIKFVSDGALRLGFISATSTSVLVTLGLSVPMALLAGAGISLIATGTTYRVDRAEALRTNPFSYLLSLQKQYGQ
ncbi:MAG: hypothetical protein HUU21_28850 [Polyangiaceae bacterium]|nr:hypothetical protein [Polyangiaceae bacterium]